MHLKEKEIVTAKAQLNFQIFVREQEIELKLVQSL